MDRARAILVHASSLADPRVNPQFWADWNEFEARPARARPPPRRTRTDSRNQLLQVLEKPHQHSHMEVSILASQLCVFP